MASVVLFKISLVLAVLSLFGPGIRAQSGCTNVLMGMAPCLNYVTGSSSTPSSSCCSQLASVVQSQPQCLCTMLNGGGAVMGISINQTLALALPGACDVKTPPVSRCDAANGAPALSPMGSQEGMIGEAPNSDSRPSSSISGSKNVPSNGYGTAATIPLAFIAIIMMMSLFATI